MSEHDYTDLLLEDVNSKFDTLLEAFGQLRGEVSNMARQTDLDEVKADIKVIKAAVTDTNHQVQDHESRITKFETISS